LPSSILGDEIGAGPGNIGPRLSATEVPTPSSPTSVAVAWHAVPAEEVCRGLGVDPAAGLTSGEVERRRARYGANKLAEGEKEPGWHAFLRQYQDLMQLVLVGAAVVSVVALQEWHTAIVVFAVTLLNAILGLNQEGKAADSVAALQKMLVLKAHVRRGGEMTDVPAEDLVPGDVVSFEAGDKVPADGRLLVAATLEIEEAALTGESTPVSKTADPVEGDDVPLSDRVCMAYMNSTVTRGRGEMVVTATGMDTEVGRISGMLQAVEQEKTPLTRQLDQLTIVVASIAGIALALVIVLGLAHGDSLDKLFLIGISVAVAAIPTELPAVVTSMLSLGTRSLAAKGRDRQAAAIGRDTRLHVGHLHRQDRDADAEPDDGPRARGRRPALRGRRRGLRDDGADPPRRRRGRDGAGTLPAPDGARERRERVGRRDRGRSDRGGTGRAGDQGGHRRRRDPPPLSAGGGGSVRLGLQVHGHVP
jgi:E1-E2 ATPase/Cation transporter/ATPase, N-terminus